MIASFTHDGSGTAPAAWHRHPGWSTAPPFILQSEDHDCQRLVVVAAHPDDESLGAGGLIATAHDAGISIYVVLLTAGEASHPESPSRRRHDLASDGNHGGHGGTGRRAADPQRRHGYKLDHPRCQL